MSQISLSCTDMANSASFCIHAPGEAQEAVKKALNKDVSDDSGEVEALVSSFPASESVKAYLDNLLNRSGKVVIRFDACGTEWSVETIDSSPIGPRVSGCEFAGSSVEWLKAYGPIAHTQAKCKSEEEHTKRTMAETGQKRHAEEENTKRAIEKTKQLQIELQIAKLKRTCTPTATASTVKRSRTAVACNPAQWLIDNRAIYITTGKRVALSNGIWDRVVPIVAATMTLDRAFHEIEKRLHATDLIEEGVGQF